MSEQDKIRVALSHVLSNVSNYPRDVQARLLGADLSKVIGEATEAVMKTGLVEEVDKVAGKPSVTRVELIVNSRREKVIYDAREVSTALQDEGKTLKVFLKSKPEQEVLREGDIVSHDMFPQAEGEVYYRNEGDDYTRVVWEGDSEPKYILTEYLKLKEICPAISDRVELRQAAEEYPEIPVGTQGEIIDWWKDRDEVLVEFVKDDEDVEVIIDKKLLKRSL